MLADRNQDSSGGGRPTQSRPPRLREVVNVVTLRGEIDICNEAAVVDQLCRALVGPKRALCVDLASVSFMDARGIAACLEAQRRARADGYDLLFVNPQGIVARLIEVLDLQVALLGGRSR